MVKIVLSDLHIGAGGIDNPLEDFRHDTELVALLNDLVQESGLRGHEVELILNGDCFEFWQVPALEDPEAYVPRARYRDRLYVATDEAACARRMRVIVAGHRAVFQALARFLSPAEPVRRISIVRGNHDIQLHWIAVQDVIREALGAHGARAAALEFVPQVIVRDGVYIEHGNQYGDPLSRHRNFRSPLHPFLPRRLRETPGARISIRVVNHLERTHPWVSSVKPLTAIFWFLLRYDTLSALRLLLLMLRHLPTLLWIHRPLTRTNRDLEEEIEAQLDAVAESDPEFVQTPLPVDGIDHDPPARALPSMLSTLYTIKTDRGLSRDPILSRGMLEEHALHAELVQQADHIARQSGVRIVSFGHTHVPAVVPLDGDATYLNTGTWTWEIDLSEHPAETWCRLIREGAAEMMEYHLTYARIDYGANGQPVATLRERRQMGAGKEHERAASAQQDALPAAGETVKSAAEGKSRC